MAALVLVAAIVIPAVALRGRSAGAATATITPVADTFVRATTPTTTYGTNGQLIADGSPVTRSFLRFDLRNVTGTVQSARLRLHVDNVADGSSPAGGTLASSSNVTWSESTTSWNSQPAIDGPVLATLGAVTRNTWVEADVTAFATAKRGSLVSFALSSTNSDGAYYDSRHTGTTAPQLVVVTQATTTTSSSTTTSTTTTSTTSTTTTTTTTTTTLPPNGSPTTLAPTADAYVENATSTTNYGGSGQLAVDSDPLREVFLRFDLSAITGPIQSVRLRLHVDDVSNGGSPSGGTVARVNDSTWSESGVVWDNRPTAWDVDIAAFGAVAQNTWVEVTVTNAVTAGTVATLGLHSTNTDGAYYDSRETGATAPQLVVTLGPVTPPVTGVKVAAVGDMVCVPNATVTASACRQQSVSNLLVGDPTLSYLLALGDLQYENGEIASFRSAYEASYGRVWSITRPAPGNHEYNTPGAPGYYTYFGSLAGDPSKGYYSFDVGSTWHIVALNSNCGAVSSAAGSAQEQWLRADLASTSRPCVAAYWHHPRFSSAASHGDDASSGAFWSALSEAGAELALAGHAHVYERYAPQLPNATPDANGIRQFVVGTGGRSLDGFSTPRPNSELRLSTFGVLQLTLGDGAYAWQFVSESGAVLDSGTGTCH